MDDREIANNFYRIESKIDRLLQLIDDEVGELTDQELVEDAAEEVREEEEGDTNGNGKGFIKRKEE